MTEILEGQECLFDQDILFGKMYPEHSAVENQKEQISKRSSKRSSKSSVAKLPLFLSLTKDGQKQDASAEWVTAAAPFPSLGEFTMRSFGEQPSLLMGECSFAELPSGVSASRLSQISEDSVHRRYYLSEVACKGILGRSSRRKSTMPRLLKEALERQATENAFRSYMTRGGTETG